MSPPAARADGVLLPLDEFVLGIAREAGRHAVQEHMETCPMIAEFKVIHADMYGPPGEKGKHPGIMGDVAELKGFRRRMERHIGRVWTAIMVVVGSIASWVIAHFSGG